MLADLPACDARNPYPGLMSTAARADAETLHGATAGLNVQYAGDAVSVEAFLRVLTGRVEAHAAGLHLDAGSTLLVYLSEWIKG